jgi:imidazolonepropionase
MQGLSYQEIATAGGGIRSTVTATRSDSAETLSKKALKSLEGMLDLGITTVECKSGYGLEQSAELKQLQVYRQLDKQQPVDLIPTFLGAHMVPDEYQQCREDYIRLLCDVLIPAVSDQKLAQFCDVFIEQGAFSIAEAREILTTAQKAGLGLKVHADQLSSGGGAQLAAELGAVSAEHLEYADENGIKALAQTGTVAVSLPLASLYLRESYLPARQMLDAGVRVAVATDFNPGSAPSYHLPLAMTLACVNQQMTPQEVLMGATTVAARAIAAEQRIGSLLPGYDADITIIDAPSVNHWLYHFRANACCGVVKSGRWQRQFS